MRPPADANDIIKALKELDLHVTSLNSKSSEGSPNVLKVTIEALYCLPNCSECNRVGDHKMGCSQRTDGQPKLAVQKTFSGLEIPFFKLDARIKGAPTSRHLPNSGAIQCWSCPFVNDIWALYGERIGNNLHCLKCSARLGYFNLEENAWCYTRGPDRDIGEAARAIAKEEKGDGDQ